MVHHTALLELAVKSLQRRLLPCGCGTSPAFLPDPTAVFPALWISNPVLQPRLAADAVEGAAGGTAEVAVSQAGMKPAGFDAEFVQHFVADDAAAESGGEILAAASADFVLTDAAAARQSTSGAELGCAAAGSEAGPVLGTGPALDQAAAEMPPLLHAPCFALSVVHLVAETAAAPSGPPV